MVNDVLPNEIPFFTANSTICTDYTFDASAKTVTCNEVGFKRFLYIYNSTRDELLYNPYNKGLLGVTSDSTITLDYPTNVFMQDSDDLIVMYESSATSVISTDYTTEVALGNTQDATTWNKFGYNLTLNNSTNEVFASFGSAFNQRLNVGETLNIVSSDAQDDSTGTGVRQLVIFGVDENWDLVTEVIALDGTSTVTTSNSFLGVNRMTIFTSGSSDSNVGAITATASTSGNVMAEMPSGQGTTQQCIFYVPRNYQFLTTWLYLEANKSSGGGNPVVSWFGKVYSGVVDSEFEVARGRLDTQLRSFISLEPSEPFVIGEKSILWFEGVSTANNTELTTGRFSGKLIKDRV